MKLIVGLGNPGEKYANNRHNVGFQFLDFLIENLSLEIQKSNIKSQNYSAKFKNNKYLQSVVAEFKKLFVLAKPLTFMNKSGAAVKKCVTCYMLHAQSDLIVIHDDLDIPLGKFKIQSGTGPQLHNGVESIEAALKTKDFLRIRIGVDNRSPDNRIDGETYVLQDFENEEKRLITGSVFLKILKHPLFSFFNKKKT